MTERYSLCCVAESAREVIRELERLGIEVLPVPNDPVLPLSLADHADLQILPTGDGRCFVNERQRDLILRLEERGLTVIPVSGIGASYPEDCRLNCYFLGSTVVGNPRCVAEEVKKEGSVLPVKQGYARCSSLVLGEDRVFTDDVSVWRALQAAGGVSCRLFPQKEILLSGYDRGFLGGSCGLTGDREMLFGGLLETLRCAGQLRQALEELGFTVREAGKDPLRDFGGIVRIF